MFLKNENEGAILHYTNSATTPSIQKMAGIAKNPLYIIDFKVKSVNDFGKWFGKSLLLEFISKNRDRNILFSPSFSDVGENCFAGREAMSMDNIESAPMNLLNKFYIPVLKGAQIEFELIEDIILVKGIL